ncbi:5690_t:CDS:10 [Paraglomus occultum]|uniref:5690_t:CDS:1 n=1 Tax=Paraglomus occultum TaxID=144539 RepID=A0A9N9CF06_9GLOM|nr:5690_t:CDS:10 [Paraglomus occultum]
MSMEERQRLCDEVIPKLKVACLRSCLREASEKVSGNKAELIERLRVALLKRRPGSSEYEAVKAAIYAYAKIPEYSTHGQLIIRAFPDYSQAPMNSTRDLVFQPSPFFEVLDRIPELCYCPASDNNTRASVEFRLTRNVIDKIRDRHTSNCQLCLFCCSDIDLSTQRRSEYALMEFPQRCEVLVNNNRLGGDLKGLKNRPGTVSPPNITHLIALDTSTVNKVEMVYDKTTKGYTFMLQLVRKISVKTLVNKIENKKFISKEQVVEKMKRQAEDADVVATTSIISLKDPLCHLRMKLPCKSVHCTHIECFDCEIFLKMNEQTPTWTCPVCNKSIASLDEIVVDGYFRHILQSVPEDQETVTIEPDGLWSTGRPSPSKITAISIKKVFEEVIVIDDSDSEDSDSDLPQDTNRFPAGKAHISRMLLSKRDRPVEIIDLTLSSDEEDNDSSAPSSKRFCTPSVTTSLPSTTSSVSSTTSPLPTSTPPTLPATSALLSAATSTPSPNSTTLPPVTAMLPTTVKLELPRVHPGNAFLPPPSTIALGTLRSPSPSDMFGQMELFPWDSYSRSMQVPPGQYALDPPTVNPAIALRCTPEVFDLLDPQLQGPTAKDFCIKNIMTT